MTEDDGIQFEKKESQVTEFEKKVLDRSEDVIKQIIQLAGSSSLFVYFILIDFRAEHSVLLK